jgi:hypothetical protein
LAELLKTNKLLGAAKVKILEILSKLIGIENKVKWSQSKKIKVVGPDFFGQYFIYVDPNFNVAIYLPKDDKTLHIFLGDIFYAQRWIRCDTRGNKVIDEKPPKEAFQWKINPNRIWYRGTGFPPNKPVYFGKVISSEQFIQSITEEWIDMMIKKYIRL